MMNVYITLTFLLQSEEKVSLEEKVEVQNGIFTHLQNAIAHYLSGAIFGNPNGSEGIHRVTLSNFTQHEVTKTVRNSDTPEKLASGLLFLLFTNQELASGNSTKPVRPDINQLDSNRFWAIKCLCNMCKHFNNNNTLHRCRSHRLHLSCV